MWGEEGGAVVGLGDCPRRKNFITPETVELFRLKLCVASKTFFKLKQHHPAASVHAQITHFKTWSRMAKQLIAILERHRRISGLRKATNLETF